MINPLLPETKINECRSHKKKTPSFKELSQNKKQLIPQALLITLAILSAQNMSLALKRNENPPYIIEESSQMDENKDYSDITIVAPPNIENSKHYNENSENVSAIAHRGYSHIAPENTIPAFVAAAQHGFKKVECDVSWTKDSVPVLLHDETINRTASRKNGFPLILPKKCSNLNYNELLDYDFGSWKGSQYKNTKIPTFAEFIDCCKENNLQPYIELKETKGFDSEKAEMLVNYVKEAGLENDVTWISFNADYLKLINEQSENCRLGYLTKDFSSDTISTLQYLNTTFNEVFLDIKAAAIDDKSSESIQDSGFYFEAWTVDTPDELDKLSSLNCRGITTNYFTNDDVNEYFLKSDIK
ncbi:MAG: glycerophosphodiester phosphodiesterase family protein [Candidatus Gastranaerophilales bacterium]|nr:glycerophosphodiester phosphodiesterase family protein [Candidatus Gastranaerophilales bacterium]